MSKESQEKLRSVTILFENDNAVTDRSGQGNNFTVSGTLSKSEDNPSNNFATMNRLSSLSTFLQGKP